jgi:hypothetical protein
MKTTSALCIPILLVHTPSVVAHVCGSKNPSNLLTIYIPTDNGILERRKVNSRYYGAMPTAPSTYACVVAEEALSILFQKAPHYFPRGTRLTEPPKVEKRSDVMSISLSKQFLQRGFWNSKRKATSAICAIINTAVADYSVEDHSNTYSARVQLLIEGRRLRNLAHIDLRKPICPHDLVVNAKRRRPKK